MILNYAFLLANFVLNRHTQPSLSQSIDYDPELFVFVTPAKRLSDQQDSSELQSDEYTLYQLSTNKLIKSK